MPESSLTSVDLPAPFSPTSASTSPARNCIETCASACTAPKRLPMARSSSRRGRAGPATGTGCGTLLWRRTKLGPRRASASLWLAAMAAVTKEPGTKELTCCDTCKNDRTVLTAPSSSAPRAVPMMEPRPPESRLPPTMAAVMAANSSPAPASGWADPARGQQRADAGAGPGEHIGRQAHGAHRNQRGPGRVFVAPAGIDPAPEHRALQQHAPQPGQQDGDQETDRNAGQRPPAEPQIERAIDRHRSGA